jgi:hypothetical protein
LLIWTSSLVQPAQLVVLAEENWSGHAGAPGVPSCSGG